MVGEEAFEAKTDAAKGQFFPGNLVGAEQCRFQAFFSGAVLPVDQFATIKQMYLMNVGYIHHRKRRDYANGGQGFLVRFTSRRGSSGFAVLHETGGQCPETMARFNGAPTEQNAFAPSGDTANDQARIFILDMAAGIANCPWMGVASGNAMADRLGALGAKMDHDFQDFVEVQRV